jgi:hypothetical protein
MHCGGNKLERWEIALIKAMVAAGRWPNDQDILAFFPRPTRSMRHRGNPHQRQARRRQGRHRRDRVDLTD